MLGTHPTRGRCTRSTGSRNASRRSGRPLRRRRRSTCGAARVSARASTAPCRCPACPGRRPPPRRRGRLAWVVEPRQTPACEAVGVTSRNRRAAATHAAAFSSKIVFHRRGFRNSEIRSLFSSSFSASRHPRRIRVPVPSPTAHVCFARVRLSVPLFHKKSKSSTAAARACSYHGKSWVFARRCPNARVADGDARQRNRSRCII